MEAYKDRSLVGTLVQSVYREPAYGPMQWIGTSLGIWAGVAGVGGAEVGRVGHGSRCHGSPLVPGIPDYAEECILIS